MADVGRKGLTLDVASRSWTVDGAHALTFDEYVDIRHLLMVHWMGRLSAARAGAGRDAGLSQADYALVEKDVTERLEALFR